MNDNPGMPSSASGLLSGDAVVGDFVNIPIEMDTRELNDHRQCQRRTEENAELRCTIEGYKEQIAEMSKQLGPPDKNKVAKLQKDMQQALVEDKQMEQIIKQCKRRAEENAELRCTIEGYKEQIAEMSKQLGPPDKNKVAKLQNDMQQALVEDKQMEQIIKQCQRRAEENAELRCTIERYKEQIAEMSKQLEQCQRGTEENVELRCTNEHYKEQIAEMSKQLGLHQKEKDCILSMATSMMPRIADINGRKVIVNSYKLDKPEDISVGSFVDNMELILNCVTAMKNEMITTEHHLTDKLTSIADKQNQAADVLKRNIQEKENMIQLQRGTEENAELKRCTIERNKAQIADMSKKLRLHQQEKDYILSMATSMMPRIAHINERKIIFNSYKLDRPEDISVGNFVDNMELILVCVTAMKNDMLTTEGNLAANIAFVVNWTNEQGQIKEGLKREIQDQAKTIDAQDKDLKIMLLRIQEIQELNSNYEGMKNENNRLRQQIHDNGKKADQQQRNQSHMNDELKRRLHHMNTDLQQRAVYIESLQRSMQDLRFQIDQKDDTIKDIKREAEDLRTRLNSLDGDKLTKVIPAITEIGDQNRPMKIAEKYGELYDNEWTDAIDCTNEVKALYPKMKTAEIEEVIIRHLYQLMMCCYRECLAMSKEQLKDVGNMIVNALKLNTKRHGRNIPCCREVSNIRRQGAAEYADYLFQHKVIVEKIVLSDWEYVHKSKELIGLLTETTFFQKCIHLCWHMAIKDPVMHLDEELAPDTAYDKGTYREFVKSGDKVAFVVWPALFLHEGGPLLNKGVVEAYC